jgi:hypothetical protein
LSASGEEPLSQAAYGMRVGGLAAGPLLSLRGAQAWPEVQLRRAELTGAAHGAGSVLGPQSASITTPAGVLELSRATRSIVVRSPQSVPDTDIVHPGLWPAAAVFARWDGLETLHAGAFVIPGQAGAWVLMADSGGGKSTLLAALALSGAEVLVDDLVVVDDGECLAGPRCIDLRPEAARRLPLDGWATTPVRSTSRRRVELDPCRARWPILGFVELVWGDPGGQVLGPMDALGVLGRHRRVIGLGAAHGALLELAGRHVLRWSRSRAFAQLDGDLEALVQRLRTLV